MAINKKNRRRKEKVKFTEFSRKQKQIYTWWHPESPVCDFDGIIADGSIRAGKTVPMSLSFIEWAFHYFDDQMFAICGKSVGSIRRNVILQPWFKPALRARGYDVHEKRTENLLVISKNGKTNYFYLFGGKDEQSQDYIQGLTLAGVLFDEVALMPESFVNQATGRCSVSGAKLWFNCNPDSPSHWFKLNWLDKAKEKHLLHVHFTMDDNPSLPDRVRERYQKMYVGVFYKRFILGLWVMAEGAIYDMWDDQENVYDELPRLNERKITRDVAIDFGTQNAMVFLEIIDAWHTIYVDNEYYYSGRKEGHQKTNSQYADDLDKFCEGKTIRYIIVDPSAASFIAELKARGYRVKKLSLDGGAINEVHDGIMMTATLIGRRMIKINRRCKNLIREIGSYVWDAKKTDKGKEQPIKKDDHGPDALRYWNKAVVNLKQRLGIAA